MNWVKVGNSGMRLKKPGHGPEEPSFQLWSVEEKKPAGRWTHGLTGRRIDSHDEFVMRSSFACVKERIEIVKFVNFKQ